MSGPSTTGVPGGPRPLRVAVIGASEWATTYHLPALKLLESCEGRTSAASEDRGTGSSMDPGGGGCTGAVFPRVRLHGIWNRTGAQAEAAARRFAIPRVYRSLEELLEDE
jgi:predicted dehydrogenase